MRSDENVSLSLGDASDSPSSHAVLMHAEKVGWRFVVLGPLGAPRGIRPIVAAGYIDFGGGAIALDDGDELPASLHLPLQHAAVKAQRAIDGL